MKYQPRTFLLSAPGVVTITFSGVISSAPLAVVAPLNIFSTICLNVSTISLQPCPLSDTVRRALNMSCFRLMTTGSTARRCPVPVRTFCTRRRFAAIPVELPPLLPSGTNISAGRKRRGDSSLNRTTARSSRFHRSLWKRSLRFRIWTTCCI